MTRRFLTVPLVGLLLAATMAVAAPAVAAPPGPIGPAGQVEGVVGFRDQFGHRQMLRLDLDAAGAPTYAATGTVRWMVGAQPGTYTEVVKWTTEAIPTGGTAYGVVFVIAGHEWGLVISYPTGAPARAWLRDLGAEPGTELVGRVNPDTLHS